MRNTYNPEFRSKTVMLERPHLCFDATPPNSQGPGTKVITFVEAPSMVLAEHKEGELLLITMMIYNPDKPVGLVYALAPEIARDLGRQLIALANKHEAAAAHEAASKLAEIRAGKAPGQAGAA